MWLGDHQANLILYCIVFIHFYSASHSLTLSEALPMTAIDTVSGFTRRSAIGNCKWRTWPKVPTCTWRLEQNLNPRPSGRKESSLPMRHHAPRTQFKIKGTANGVIHAPFEFILTVKPPYRFDKTDDTSIARLLSIEIFQVPSRTTFIFV